MANKPRDLVIGDNLEVHYVGGTVKYYKITGIDDIFYEDAHATAVDAGGMESYAEISNLNPPEGQLYYFDGVEVDGNVKVRLKQPAATSRLGTMKSPEGGLLRMITSGVGGPRQVNLWVVKDYPPNVQLENFTDVSCTVTLYWIGLRFSIVPMISKPQLYTPVRIGGIAE